MSAYIRFAPIASELRRRSEMCQEETSRQWLTAESQTSYAAQSQTSPEPKALEANSRPATTPARLLLQRFPDRSSCPLLFPLGAMSAPQSPEERGCDSV